MTGITDNQVREIQWASSEEGKAQFAAAWNTVQQLGLDAHGLTHADVGALLWAAHEASRPEPPEDPRKARMLELITARGEAGMTIREVAIAFYAESRIAVTREALHKWASEYERDGTLTRANPPRPGHWMAVNP